MRLPTIHSALIQSFALACACYAASCARCIAETNTPAATPTTPLQTVVGETVPSDDALIPDFHSIGLIEGHANIFRSACPVRQLAKTPTAELNDAEKLAQARSRMRHLKALGVKTIISFEDSTKKDPEDVLYPSDRTDHMRPSVALERTAAEAEGIRYVSRPILNDGPNSMQTMSDADVQKLLESRSEEILEAANEGGVLFHCSAGHDRAGIVTAYMRINYQHWPVDEAIAEMRRYGHNWPKFSRNGGESSWHEQHLRAIAAELGQARNTPVAAER